MTKFIRRTPVCFDMLLSTLMHQSVILKITHRFIMTSFFRYWFLNVNFSSQLYSRDHKVENTKFNLFDLQFLNNLVLPIISIDYLDRITIKTEFLL